LTPSGVGPGVAFAVEYLRLKNDEALAVILVPAAEGGTNINQWAPLRKDGSLYAEAVKRTLAASAYGSIEGALFFQGENDAEGDPDDHQEDWGEKFEEIVASLRLSLYDESLPIVFAQLGENPSDSQLWEAVKDSQAGVHLHRVAMIYTDDLPYAEGSIHFTTPAYLEIGLRFARALVALGG
jgi:hypothetical protein